MAGAYTVGDTGTELIIAEWIPDPNEIAAQLLWLSEEFENMYVPLEAARRIAMYDTGQHFKKEEDPDGIGWLALTKKYVDSERGGAEHPILRLTDDLYTSVMRESTWFIAENSLFFTDLGLPYYSSWHQTGTGEGRNLTPGSRQHRITQFVRSEAFVERAPEEKIPETPVGLRGVESFGGSGRGQSLPARPFIGLSFEAEEEIQREFQEWFDTRIDLAWHMEVPFEATPDEPGLPKMAFVKGVQYEVIGFTSRQQPIVRTPRGPRFGGF